MSEQESKTEQPSQKRIADTIEKGNTPFSREVVTFASLLAALAGLSLTAAGSARNALAGLYGIFDRLDQKSLETGADAGRLVQAAVVPVFLSILPLVGVIAIGGIIGSIGQNVPSATLERLMPKYERISPAANLSRIFGLQALGEFAKSAAKILIVGFILFHVFRNNLMNATINFSAEVAGLPARLLEFCLAVLAPVCVFAFLVAVADVAWTRMRWYKNLRMTRQELKEEMRQSEGDMQLKERIKSIARNRVRKRMMAQLPKATLVVVNPTHYAVALRYVPSEGGAPQVIAKGIDSLALKIREFCASNGIAVIEDKPLARALHKECNIGDMIPPEFYKAVAEIIHFIELRKRLASRRLA